MNIEIALRFPTGSGVSRSVHALADALKDRRVEIVVACNHMEIAKQYIAGRDNINCIIRKGVEARLNKVDLLTIVSEEAADHVAVLHEVNTVCQRMHDLQRMLASQWERLPPSVFHSTPIAEPLKFRIEDCKIDTYGSSGRIWARTTAVRLTHIPTGMCRTEDCKRSAHANREQAAKDLEIEVNEFYRSGGRHDI